MPAPISGVKICVLVKNWGSYPRRTKFTTTFMTSIFLISNGSTIITLYSIFVKRTSLPYLLVPRATKNHNLGSDASNFMKYHLCPSDDYISSWTSSDSCTIGLLQEHSISCQKKVRCTSEAWNFETKLWKPGHDSPKNAVLQRVEVHTDVTLGPSVKDRGSLSWLPILVL